MATPKANYKVYDRKLGKFISPGHRSKSTWSSETWALNAAWDHAKNQVRRPLNNGYFILGDFESSKRDIEQYMAENMDLYTYPVQNAIIESLADRMEANRKEAELKKAALEEKNKQKKTREIEERKYYLHSKIEMLQEELDLLNKE
jgi:hypothetical protein